MFRISGFLTFGNQAKQLLPTKNMARDRNSETNSPKHLPESHSQEAKWESLIIIKKQHVRAFKKQKKYLPGVPIFHPIFPPFFLLRLQFLSNNFGSPTCWQGFGAWPFGSTPQNPPVSSWVSLGFPPPPSDATYVHPGYDVGTWDGRRTVGLK